MKEYFVWLFKLLTIIVLIVVVLPLTLGIVVSATKDSAVSGNKKNSVAVVELNGAIEDSKEILEDLEKQAANDKVKGIVLAINSPGGGVGASQDIYEAVKRLKKRKPIIVSMGGVAASGGLYAALGATKIYAQPGTITGSIGVIMQVPNFSKIAEKIGVDMITVKSGQLKDIGNSFREMTPEERAFLEGFVSEAHQDFIRAVADGRGIPVEEVRKFADGRVLLGTQAKDLKLVDAFGDRYVAAREVFEQLGTPLKEDEYPTLVYANDNFKELKKILEGVTNILPVAFSRQWELKYLMY